MKHHYQNHKNNTKNRYDMRRLIGAVLVAIFSLFFGHVRAQVTTVTLNYGTASPFTVPAGVTSINVQVWGGGGAGGGAQSGSTTAGSGGGGGGYAALNNIAVLPFQNIPFSIGAGGVGANDTNGTAGGASTMLGLTANGGGGGGRRGGTAGTGGTASGGTTNTTGTNGVVAGNGGAGANGGAGGAVAGNGNGGSGTVPGGGGGGGKNSSIFTFTDRAGGAGANGRIVITYTLPTLSSIPASICANSTITLNGTNFIAPLTVTFNGVPASTVNIISANQLQVVVPGGATSGNIRVTTSTGYTTNAGTATVNNPVVGGPNSVCQNGTINVTPASGGTWSSSNPAIASVTNAGVVTANAPGVATLTFTELPSGCQATKTITVNPLPVINSQPVSQSVCTGSIVTISVGTPVAGLNYQWYNGAVPMTNGGNISGANSATLTFNTVTLADASVDYHCVVSGICAPTVISNVVSLTVNERITITTQPIASQTVCAGTSVSLAVSVTGTSPTFQWYKGAMALVDGGTISGANSSILTINPVSTADASNNYYCMVSGVGACLPVTSSNSILIVNEIPVINSNPVALNTVCDEDPVSLSIQAVGGSLTYQWYKGATPVVDGGNISGSQTDTLNFVPISVSDAATNYYCVVTNSCTSVTSTLAEVVVNLKPKVPAQSASTCSDIGFNLNIVNGVPTPATFIPAGTTYTWSAPVLTGGMTGGTAEVGQSSIFGVLHNPTNVAQTATYTVVPTSGTAGFCVGNPFVVTVTVNPVADIANMTPSICSGQLLTITPTNGSGNIVPSGTTYSWGLPVVTGGLTGATTGSGSASFSQTLTNPTNVPQTATYVVTPLSGSCIGASFTIIVSVEPKPTLGIAPASQSLCSGVAITPITFTNPNGIPGTVTYNWTRDNLVNLTGIPGVGTGTINGTLTNATSVSQTTTFTIYAYSDQGCISVAGTATVTLDPSSVVNAIANQTICSGANITPVNLSASVAGTTFSWTRTNTANISGIPNGSGATISGSLVNLTNVPQLTTFTVTPTAGGCTNAAGAKTFSITVNPSTAASATPATQTVCGGQSFSITASETNGVAGTVFSFTKDSTVAGDAVSISGNTISGSLENNSLVDRVVTFTITATANGCPSTTTVTVTVRPNPAFTLTPATQNLCNGGTITTVNFPVVAGVTYSWTRTNPLALGNLSGMPDSAVNATSISGTLINNTTANQTTVFTVTATINGCSKTRTVSVTVYATLTAPVITDTQTVCAGSRPTPLVMTTLPGGGSGGYTYQWQSASSSSGPWANVAGATGASYWPPTTNASTPTTFYQLIVSNPACGTSVTSNAISVAVANNLNFTFSISGGGATVCPGAAFNPTVTSGQFLPDSYILYTWTADVNYVSPSTGGPVGSTTYWPFPWLPIFAISSATLPLTTINNTTANVTTTVYITPNIYDTDTNAFICSLSPQAVNVTIRPMPMATITAPSNGQLICSASSAGVTVTSNLTGPFTITRSANASVTSSNTFPLTTASVTAGTPYTLNDILTNNSGTTQAVTYTVTPTSNGCPGTGQTITINVAPRLLPGSIGTNHTICFGGDPNLLTETVAATGATSYSWEYSTTSATGPWTTIVGATGTTYDPPAPVTVTTWYRRVVSSSASGIPCSVAVTTPVQVTVNTMTPGSIGSDQTVCSPAGTITLSSITPGTGLATLSYQWQSNTVGCASAFTNIAGATGATYTIPAGLSTTTYFRRVTKSTAGTCEVYSNCVTIYVNNVTGGTVGTDEVLCNTTNPAAFSELTPSTGSGTLTYQWQSTTSATGCSAASTWTNIPFATSSIYDPPAGVTVTTWFRRVTTSTLNGVQCSANSNCIMVTANSVTAGTITPNSRTICSGGDPAAFNNATAGTGTALTYQWQSSPTGAAGTWVDIVGATAASYDPPGPVTATTYYRRVATGTVGGSSCQAFTTAVTVFVNDVTAPVMAGNQTVCSEDPAAFTISTPATASGTLSYQWQSNTTGCGGAWANIAGATAAIYDPPILTQTTYYRVVVTSTLNAVQCTAISNCLTITSFAKTWNGSVSNDWNTANNWTPVGVPTSGHCVIIPNTAPNWHAVISGSGYIGYAYNVTVLNGGLLEINPSNSIVVTDRVAVNVGGGFNVLNSANLVQVNNVANTGIVNMYRITQPMYRFDYTYWNNPMVMGSYTLGNLSQNLTQPDKYYSWNPSISGGNGGWIQESAATVMNPAKGYIVRAPNTFSFTPTVFTPYTAIFTGTPNNGDVAVPIAIGSLGPGTNNDKLNLIGNPFASAVSAFDFVNDPANVNLVDGTLYFWTHHAPPSTAFPNPFYGTFQINYSPNGYATLNALGGTNTVPIGYGGPLPIDNIAAGQSFFIVGKASGTAYFRNSMRRTGDNSAFFRAANPYASPPTPFESHRIWLNMADTQGSFNQILVGYADGATNGHDRNYDGESFSAGGITIYSINEGRKYTIQGRTLPFDITDVVPIGYSSTVSREFTIGIDHLDGLFDSQNVYLEDKSLGIIHDLKQNPYTFATEIGTFDERFVLRYTNSTLGVDDLLAHSGVTAFIKNKILHVKAGHDIERIQIFDLTGKLITTFIPDGNVREFEKEFEFAQGIYIGKIKLVEGDIVNEKLSNGN